MTNDVKKRVLGKWAKKFALSASECKKQKRTDIAGICYHPDGCVYVTDKLQALRIRDVHSETVLRVVHSVTGQEMSTSFPDFYRTFELMHKSKTTIPFHAAELPDLLTRVRSARGAASGVSPKFPVVVLKTANDSADLYVDHLNYGISFHSPIQKINDVENEKHAINGNHLYNAVHMFKSFDIPMDIRLSGRYDPVFLTNDDVGIDVLLVPYHSLGSYGKFD